MDNDSIIFNGYKNYNINNIVSYEERFENIFMKEDEYVKFELFLDFIPLSINQKLKIGKGGNMYTNEEAIIQEQQIVEKMLPYITDKVVNIFDGVKAYIMYMDFYFTKNFLLTKSKTLTKHDLTNFVKAIEDILIKSFHLGGIENIDDNMCFKEVITKNISSEILKDSCKLVVGFEIYK